MEVGVWAFIGQVVSTPAWKTAHQEKLLKPTLEYQDTLLIITGLALIFIVYILKENSFITETSLITLCFHNRDLLF